MSILGSIGPDFPPVRKPWGAVKLFAYFIVTTAVVLVTMLIAAPYVVAWLKEG